MSPLAACLRFALSIEDIDRVVVGVDSLQQLQEIVAAAAGPMPPVPDRLRCVDPDLVNPARWNQL